MHAENSSKFYKDMLGAKVSAVQVSSLEFI